MVTISQGCKVGEIVRKLQDMRRSLPLLVSNESSSDKKIVNLVKYFVLLKVYVTKVFRNLDLGSITIFIY